MTTRGRDTPWSSSMAGLSRGSVENAAGVFFNPVPSHPTARARPTLWAPSSGYGVQELAADMSSPMRALRRYSGWMVPGECGGAFRLSWSKRKACRTCFRFRNTEKPASDTSRFGLPAKETRGLALRLRRNRESALEYFSRMMFAPHELSGKVTILICLTGIVSEQQSVPAWMRRSKPWNCCFGDTRCVLSGIRVPVLLVHGYEGSNLSS